MGQRERSRGVGKGIWRGRKEWRRGEQERGERRRRGGRGKEIGDREWRKVGRKRGEENE